MSGKVVAVKLITGEEIIATLKETLDPANYTFERARILNLGRDANGNMGYGLMPWIHSNMDGSITVSREHVIAMIQPVKQIEDGYMQETSGIQLASSLPPKGKLNG